MKIEWRKRAEEVEGVEEAEKVEEAEGTEQQPIKQPMDIKRKRTIVILSLGAVVCAAITLFLLYDYHKTNRDTERALAELRLEDKSIKIEMPQESAPETPVVTEEPLTENPYAEAFGEYPDIQGWLIVDGTVIDYPLLQREGEDEYYLYRNFQGEDDKKGSLILDEDSSVRDGEFTTNLLIHGHNMKDGSMFGGLDDYKAEEFCEEHRYMSLYTRDGKYDYEVVAVFESQVFYVTDKVFKYYQFFQADTEEEFHYFYDNIKKLSLYDTGVEAQFGDRFLTLSTCAYHVEDGRFVVVAKEIGQEEKYLPVE